jgi:nucleotide-binding universal stress UspA family protein
MFRKILVCSDTSPASDLLIECAGELKTVGMEEVVLAHVLPEFNVAGYDQVLVREMRPILEKQKAVLEQVGIEATIDMQFGIDPARSLRDLAEKHAVSAIFIGSHGKGILRSALLGSVTAGLLPLTDRPLLLARIALLEDECALVCRKMFARAIFPTDFSETAENALNYLGKIAADTKCSVRILHVMENSADAETAKLMEAESRSFMESKKRRLESMGAVDVSVELASGDPAKEILARAKEEDFSIIVMGTNGKGIVKEVLLGSVSNEVARHAGIPILLIPPERDGRTGQIYTEGSQGKSCTPGKTRGSIL